MCYVMITSFSVSSNDLLLASTTYRLLITHFTKHLSDGHINTNNLVDIIRCLLAGTALPTEYHNHLCSQQCNQTKHDTVETIQPCTQLNISSVSINFLM